jgi:hypothetical protein
MRRKFRAAQVLIAVAVTTLASMIVSQPASAGAPKAAATETRAAASNHVLPSRLTPKKPGGNAPKVGLYQCPSGPISQVTYLSILPGGKFLGPYTKKSSKPSRFRLTGGAMHPGGRILKMLDGPYKNLQDVRYEYYPAGASPFGTRYDVPYLHIVNVPPYFIGACYWTQKDPYRSR